MEKFSKTIIVNNNSNNNNNNINCSSTGVSDKSNCDSYKEYWEYFSQTYNVPNNKSVNTNNRSCHKVSENKIKAKRKYNTEQTTPRITVAKSVEESNEINTCYNKVFNNDSDSSNNTYSPQICMTGTEGGLTTSQSSSHSVYRTTDSKSNNNSNIDSSSNSNITINNNKNTHSPEMTLQFALDVERVLFTPEDKKVVEYVAPLHAGDSDLIKTERRQEQQKLHELINQSLQPDAREEKYHYWSEWEREKSIADLQNNCDVYSELNRDEFYSRQKLLTTWRSSSESNLLNIYNEEESASFNTNNYNNSDDVNMICIELSDNDDDDDAKAVNDTCSNVKTECEDVIVTKDSPNVMECQNTSCNFNVINSSKNFMSESKEFNYIESNHDNVVKRYASPHNIESIFAMESAQNKQKELFTVDRAVIDKYTQRLTTQELQNTELLEFFTHVERVQEAKRTLVEEARLNFLCLPDKTDNITESNDKNENSYYNCQTHMSLSVNKTSRTSQLLAAYAHTLKPPSRTESVQYNKKVIIDDNNNSGRKSNYNKRNCLHNDIVDNTNMITCQNTSNRSLQCDKGNITSVNLPHVYVAAPVVSNVSKNLNVSKCTRWENVKLHNSVATKDNNTNNSPSINSKCNNNNNVDNNNNNKECNKLGTTNTHTKANYCGTSLTKQKASQLPYYVHPYAPPSRFIY